MGCNRYGHTSAYVQFGTVIRAAEMNILMGAGI